MTTMKTKHITNLIDTNIINDDESDTSEEITFNHKSTINYCSETYDDSDTSDDHKSIVDFSETDDEFYRGKMLKYKRKLEKLKLKLENENLSTNHNQLLE